MRVFASIFCTLALLVLISCSPAKTSDLAPIDAETTASEAVLGSDLASWAEAFPKEYASFTAATEAKAVRTTWGGSEPYDKLAEFPELKSLYAGSGFAIEYKEDRNHVFAWEDLLASDRITSKTPASCLVCKTADIEQIYQTSSWDFAQEKLVDYTSQGHNGITCATCHDPASKKLRVIQPAFVESLETRQIQWDSLSHREQATLTCAQCHVEYYFEPVTNRVVHPLDAGTSPEAMYAYYQTKPNGFEGDFVHTISGAKMLKAQHPDFEDFSSGVHAAAGLSCADCHMPQGTHFVKSPLDNIENSCLPCHKGKTSEWLETRVLYNQNAVASMQSSAGLSLVSAHELIGDFVKANVQAVDKITQARELVREAQWYYDYIASSNSMGFHNPVQALKSLGQALKLTQDIRILLN